MLHECKGSLPTSGYGDALYECIENEVGEFWVSNGEYGSQVNYCPYCGAKAPNQTDTIHFNED